MTTGTGKDFSPIDAKPPVGTTPTVEETSVNVDLLRKVMDYINTHPITWQQGSWFWVLDPAGNRVPHLVEIEFTEVNSCDTAMCFAGHAALMEGFPSPPKYNHAQWERSVEGKYWPETVDEFARKRLGLGVDVAEELFASENTLEDLNKMVDYLIENPNASWEDLVDIREEYSKYDKDY